VSASDRTAGFGADARRRPKRPLNPRSARSRRGFLKMSRDWLSPKAEEAEYFVRVFLKMVDKGRPD